MSWVIYIKTNNKIRFIQVLILKSVRKRFQFQLQMRWHCEYKLTRQRSHICEHYWEEINGWLNWTAAFFNASLSELTDRQWHPVLPVFVPTKEPQEMQGLNWWNIDLVRRGVGCLSQRVCSPKHGAHLESQVPPVKRKQEITVNTD